MELKRVFIFGFIIASFGFLFTTRISWLHSQSIVDSTSHLVDVIIKFEAFAQDTLEKCDAPGAAVAVVKDDKILYINGFGVREVGRPEPVDIHTVFRLGSVSKGFASVLTGILVENGVLNWDDTVVKYLPDFSLQSLTSTQNLTIRHILSHTSGLPQHTFTDLVEDNVPFDVIVRNLSEVPPISPVGKLYAYQNVVYSLIAPVVKSATGEDYEELIAKNIFEPLEMSDASLGRDAFMASPNRAMPHVRRVAGWTSTEVKNAYYSVPPAAGVNASILDMAKWLRAMMGGAPEIISAATIQEVTKPHVKTPQERRKFRGGEFLNNASYGLGWRVFNYAGKKLVYHGGWVAGYRAEIGFIQEERIGIVVLMNFENMITSHFLPRFFELYFDFPNDDPYHNSH